MLIKRPKFYFKIIQITFFFAAASFSALLSIFTDLTRQLLFVKTIDISF